MKRKRSEIIEKLLYPTSSAKRWEILDQLRQLTIFVGIPVTLLGIGWLIFGIFVEQNIWRGSATLVFMICNMMIWIDFDLNRIILWKHLQFLRAHKDHTSTQEEYEELKALAVPKRWGILLILIPIIFLALVQAFPQINLILWEVLQVPILIGLIGVMVIFGLDVYRLKKHLSIYEKQVEV